MKRETRDRETRQKSETILISNTRRYAAIVVRHKKEKAVGGSGCSNEMDAMSQMMKLQCLTVRKPGIVGFAQNWL
jgi:hypothetical protein